MEYIKLQQKMLRELSNIAFYDPAYLVDSQTKRLMAPDELPKSLRSAIEVIECCETKTGNKWKYKFYDKILALKILLQHFSPTPLDASLEEPVHFEFFSSPVDTKIQNKEN